MKLKESDLRDLCAGNGYTGADDFASRKAWVVTQPIDVKAADGTLVDVKDIEWEPAARKAFTVAKPANADEPTEDIKAKARGELINELKGLGINFAAGQARGVVNPGQITVGKSWQERLYEKRIESKQARFSDYSTALAAKHWWGAQIAARQNNTQLYDSNIKEFGRLNELLTGKAYATNSTSNGAAVVPEIFRPDLIKNVDNYGAYPQLTRVIESPTEPKIILPRNTGSLTAYWPAQNATITTSTGSYDNVQLDAQTVAVSTQASNQILNDSGINLVDDIMDDMSRAIALLMDKCLLIGDGSATYGGMTGFEQKFGVAATDGGYVVVGGTTSDAHTVAQLALAVARLPQYAMPGAVWTCSQAMFGMVFARLMTSTAVTALTQQNLAGLPQYSFLGFPIVINNVMSSVNNASATNRPGGFTAASQVDILFGNFARASKMIKMQDIAIEMDTSVGFNSYSTYFRAVARFQTVVHDVGTSTAAGPVVSFWQN